MIAIVTTDKPRQFVGRHTPPPPLIHLATLFHTNCDGMGEAGYCYRVSREDWYAIDNSGCWLCVSHCPWCGGLLPSDGAE